MTGGRTFARFDESVRRGAVDKILGASDKIAAPAAAVAEIRELVDALRNDAVIPSGVIRSILSGHGL